MENEEKRQALIEACSEGEINPIDLAVKLAAIEKVCEKVREGINEQVVTELEKEQRKTTRLGANVECKEVGTKWNYTGSEAWNAVKQQEDKVAEKRKAIESIAKSLPEGSESSFTDTDTGDTYEVVRGTKTSKTSFAVTLGK